MCERLGQPPVIGEIAAGILLVTTATTWGGTALAARACGSDWRVRARWTTS
ncbi:hypothetical protein ACFY0R_36125 [Streptomyces sp. NPDC001633]|uniref:hypothetical protein n=1 Tax=Streptomyces sp. NPDC001633 TaxID=3364595 RepID=UPI003689EE7B